jgi:glutamyl-tRNA reductase
MTTMTVIGISFHTAPLDVRERASLRASRIGPVLQHIREDFPGCELVLVSTCNRTELYTAGVDVTTGRQRLIRHLTAGGADDATVDIGSHFYVKTDRAAAEHLFAVAASLDAMVVGETEILGQVKQAFARAEEAGTVGKTLSPLFQNAFRTAKRVHAETDICRGRVSVSSLAVSFAEKVFDDLPAKTVMLVGAGDMAELALKSLMEHGVRDVVVMNRSHARGQALAGQCAGRAVPYELLDDYLACADIVISSTSAPHLVIHAPAIRRAIAARHGRPILLIDIAVPRDIDPEAAQIPNVYLYSIDDLQRVAADNLAQRQKAVDQAWAIVREETAALTALFEGLGLRALLRQLDDLGRDACETALRRAFAKEKLAALPEPCREEIRTLAHKIANKMLAEPREALKRAARDGGWDAYARVTRELYGFREAPPGNQNTPADGDRQAP